MRQKCPFVVLLVVLICCQPVFSVGYTYQEEESRTTANYEETAAKRSTIEQLKENGKDADEESSAQPESNAKDPEKKEEPASYATGYPIHAGDKLNIEVYREKQLSGIFTVGNQGDIDYPLLGKVHAEGLSLEKIRKNLTDNLGRDYLVDPQVQVNLEKSVSKSVSVLGQVTKPGNYDFTQDMTIVRLISAAEGFTRVADASHVRLTRIAAGGKRRIFQVNVASIMDGRSDDLPLEPGDIVFVPESAF